MMLLWFTVGTIAGSAICYFFIKSKNISIAKYDALTQTLNEAKTSEAKSEVRSEERIRNTEEKFNSLNKLYEDEKSLVQTKQNQVNSLKEDVAKITAINSSLSESNESNKTLLRDNSLKIDDLTNQISELKSLNNTLIANNKSLEEKLSTQKEEISAMQKASHLEFTNLANKILEEKSEKFSEFNKTNINAILKPLGENIEAFKKKVEDTYDRESKQRFSLDEKIKDLLLETNKISNEANNLATALKGQVKKQGSWGEMILESILQQSGLVKDSQYSKEPNIKDEDGKNLRPDFLIYLPEDDKGNKRTIITDSKMSLVAYDSFSSSDTQELQSIHLKEHLKSIYRHVDSLSEKKYDDLESSVDFTIMFIPIEPAYLTAIQNDPELWSYAYKKGILLMSPTNLIVCLKLVSDLWKRDMQSKNALDIVKRGEMLYEKFVGFSESILEVGKHIEKTQFAYNGAIDKLKTGRGNLIDQAVKLKNLGLKSNKKIPDIFIASDMDEVEIISDDYAKTAEETSA